MDLLAKKRRRRAGPTEGPAKWRVLLNSDAAAWAVLGRIALRRHGTRQNYIVTCARIGGHGKINLPNPEEVRRQTSTDDQYARIIHTDHNLIWVVGQHIHTGRRQRTRGHGRLGRSASSDVHADGLAAAGRVLQAYERSVRTHQHGAADSIGHGDFKD